MVSIDGRRGVIVFKLEWYGLWKHRESMLMSGYVLWLLWCGWHGGVDYLFSSHCIRAMCGFVNAVLASCMVQIG